MKTHKDLDIWKLGINLVESVYGLTQNFPVNELFGITSQIKKSAISVPSNIAEGAARNSKKEFIQFLYISLGSLSELETQFIISKKLHYLKNDEILNDIEELRKKMLNFIKYQKAKL